MKKKQSTGFEWNETIQRMMEPAALNPPKCDTGLPCTIPYCHVCPLARSALDIEEVMVPGYTDLDPEIHDHE